MSAHPVQNLYIAIIAGTPFIAGAFVGLRVYARRRLGTALGWDDYLVLIAWFLSIGLVYPSVRNIYLWHYGWHIWEIPAAELEPDWTEYNAIQIGFNILNTPVLPLVKASIIMLLLRVGSILKPIRIVLYATLVFVIASCIGPWIALLFICHFEKDYQLSKTVYNGIRCLDREPNGVLILFLVSANLLTDLLIFPIPSYLMRGLRGVSLKARLTLIATFALSLGAAAIGIVRMVMSYRAQLYAVNDYDWTFTNTFYLFHLENNVAIVIACLPTLRSLVSSWRAKEDITHKTAQTGSRSQQSYGRFSKFYTSQSMPSNVEATAPDRQSDDDILLIERPQSLGSRPYYSHHPGGILQTTEIQVKRL